MKCKWKDCSNEARDKSPFCSGTCKKRSQRASGTKGVEQVGQTASGTQVGQEFEPVWIPGFGEDGKVEEGRYVRPLVYNRPAVKFTPDQYDTRPEPLSPDDIPHKGGRGKYTRQDGTVYQFDSGGRSHELTNNVAYQTIEDVQACYA